MASVAPDMMVRGIAGETVDALVWRAVGKGPGAVEAVLEANPGLAARGPVLVEGQLVAIPTVKASEAAVVPLIQLWD